MECRDRSHVWTSDVSNQRFQISFLDVRLKIPVTELNRRERGRAEEMSSIGRPMFLLLQRSHTGGAATNGTRGRGCGSGAAQVKTYDPRLIRAEGARTGCACGCGNTLDVIPVCVARRGAARRCRYGCAAWSHCERVATLTSGRQDAVNEHTRVASRLCGCRRSDLGERRRKAIVVGRDVRYGSRVDRANRADGRGLVGGHARAQQIRNSDGCDNQNYRHHDQ
jgi:hypothetical protein